jgi:hypothetical protein
MADRVHRSWRDPLSIENLDETPDRNHEMSGRELTAVILVCVLVLLAVAWLAAAGYFHSAR